MGEGGSSKPLIRIYHSGDEEEIVHFLQDTSKPWPRFDIDCSPIEHWKWKFLENPTNKDVFPHIVAEDDGRIIGVTHGMLFRIKIGDGTYLCAKPADLVIHPDYQGRGIFSRMDKLRLSTFESLGSHFFYALTSNPIIINRQIEKTRSLFPHPIKALIKIEDVNKYFKYDNRERSKWKRLYLKMGLYILITLNKLANIKLKPSKRNDVTVVEVSRFDERIDNFYDKVKSSYNFIVEKSHVYMNWRYCDKRGGDFKVWVAEVNEEILGYLVLRINNIDEDNPIGYIMDVLAVEGREDIIENFIQFSRDYFKTRRVNAIHIQVVGGHIYERIFNKYGFIDTMVKPYLRYGHANIGEDLEKFRGSSASMLHYPYGEGDTI